MSKINAHSEHYDHTHSSPLSFENELLYDNLKFTRYHLQSVKKAFPFLISSVIAILVLLVVILTLIYGLKLDETARPSSTIAPSAAYSTRKGIGESCTMSSECILSAFCDLATTDKCSCSPQFYYDLKEGACILRKAYGQHCFSSVECQYLASLSCINDVCSCDPTLFYWNSRTLKCEDLRGLGQSCMDSKECLSSTMKCDYYKGGISKRCMCASSHYYSFKTGACETRKGHGVQCFNDNAHFECVENAWCAQFPNDLTYRCSCHPYFYWDSSAYYCTEKKSVGSSCINSFECNDYLGQICDSNTNKCSCPSTFYWNVTSCIPKQSLGGICNKTSDCLYSGLLCTFRPEKQDHACICPKGTYFSVRTKSCVNFLNIGDICEDNYNCPINTTCKYENLSSNKVCKCSEDLYYQVSGTNDCAILKNYTQSCLYSNECNAWLGLLCRNNRCQCPVSHFYNGYECEQKKGVDAVSYQKFCFNAYECKNSSLVLVCYEGSCKCEHGKTFNPTTNLCS